MLQLFGAYGNLSLCFVCAVEFVAGERSTGRDSCGNQNSASRIGVVGHIEAVSTVGVDCALLFLRLELGDDCLDLEYVYRRAIGVAAAVPIAEAFGQVAMADCDHCIVIGTARIVCLLVGQLGQQYQSDAQY